MTANPHQPSAALVIGANGGIGRAVADVWDNDDRFVAVHRVARQGALAIDITDSNSIAALLSKLRDGETITHVLIATGLLHDPATGKGPKKSLREIDGAWLARQLQVNLIGPALLLAQFLPMLPRDRPVVVAALGARVGSISDNRRGGWYGYRAAKAGLHQFVRTAAIEWARSHPLATLVAIHPGTVDTPLSQPFQRALPTGQLQSPPEAAERITQVLDTLTPGQSGHIFDHQGAEIIP